MSIFVVYLKEECVVLHVTASKAGAAKYIDQHEKRDHLWLYGPFASEDDIPNLNTPAAEKYHISILK